MLLRVIVGIVSGSGVVTITAFMVPTTPLYQALGVIVTIPIILF